MEERNLGKSGLKVSIIGLGCNNFGWRVDTEAARKVVHKALDLGVTLLDTSDYYGNKGGSETALGEILGPRRKDVILATKFGLAMHDDAPPRNASRRYIMMAVEASLKRLKTDWIDLYQLHKPDPDTPLEETLRALDDLIRQGKVRYIGCSNLPAWEVADAHWIAKQNSLNTFISCQDHYSLLARDIEAALIPAMARFGLGLLPYFPLASGLLTGKYRQDADLPPDTRLAVNRDLGELFMTPGNWSKLAGFERFAADRGETILNLAFAWLRARPAVSSIIAGATRPEQVEQNAAAVEWKLSESDLAEIDLFNSRHEAC